jgi:hypothetical protein
MAAAFAMQALAVSRSLSRAALAASINPTNVSRRALAFERAESVASGGIAEKFVVDIGFPCTPLETTRTLAVWPHYVQSH